MGLVAQRYYEMFKRYGGLPWIDHYITMGESIDMSRMSITRTVDSICRLLDRAIAMPELPERNAVNEFGRVNKVALRMLKARVLLWSASPLFNPEDNQSYYPSFNKQELIKHETYDKNRWQEAADACLEAINAAHGAGYALYTKYGDPVKDYKAAVTEFPDIDANGTRERQSRNHLGYSSGRLLRQRDLPVRIARDHLVYAQAVERNGRHLSDSVAEYGRQIRAARR